MLSSRTELITQCHMERKAFSSLSETLTRTRGFANGIATLRDATALSVRVASLRVAECSPWSSCSRSVSKRRVAFAIIVNIFIQLLQINKFEVILINNHLYRNCKLFLKKSK